MKRPLMSNIIYIGAVVMIVLAITLRWPIVIKEHRLNKIKSQIEKVEKQIEYNKQQWLNCEQNMKLWNEENESNRNIVNELKVNYNNMVGFTEAWQPE